MVLDDVIRGYVEQGSVWNDNAAQGLGLIGQPHRILVELRTRHGR
jgi:hypothetical protein